jgi:iron complex outermembrane receptor protein
VEDVVLRGLASHSNTSSGGDRLGNVPPLDASGPGPGRARAAWSAAPVLAAVLAAVPAVAAPPSGRVVGTVRDPSGAPLADAEVTLRGALERRAPCDAEGAFAFEGLADGAYEVRATLAGRAPARTRVRVAGGRAPVVSLVLLHLAFDSVVVTAAKAGERDPRTLPMSLGVLPAEDLERLQATSVANLAGRAAGVTFSQNAGFAQLTIRGIGTNSVFTGSDPSSAVYVDGVYLARPAMVLSEFVDLERVEVVTGPHGPLYGRNALGGVINVITAAPVNELEAEVRLGAGGLGARRASGRMAGPIVDGRVMASAAFLRGVRRGFVRDVDHPEHPLGGEDATAGRAKLRLLLGPRSDLLLAADATLQDAVPLFYSKVLAVKPGFTVDNPPGVREVRASTLAESRNLQKGASARFAQRLPGGATLTDVLAYRSLDYDLLIDSDITELELTATGLREVQHQWSNELTVSSSPTGLAWTAGVFLFADDDRQPSRVRLAEPGLVNAFEPRVRSRSGAVFGQATAALAPRIRGTAGLRYTRESKTLESSGGLYAETGPGTAVPGSAYSFRDSLSNDAWSPRLGLDLDLGPRVLAYAAATRGFKSGGFNISSRGPGEDFAPEWAWSYEAGLKSTLAGGRARLNLAVFHTDYRNLQVLTTIRPGVAYISNAAAATIRGAELDGAWQLGSRLRVGGHLAWLDSRYDEYIAVDVGGATGDVSGRFLSNAPEWSGRTFVDWSLAAGRVGTVSLRADARLQSTVYFTPFNDAVQRQRPYGLIDGSLELRRGRLAITAYARNLAGADYVTGTFGAALPAIGGRPGEPRLLGVELALGN